MANPISSTEPKFTPIVPPPVASKTKSTTERNPAVDLEHVGAPAQTVGIPKPPPPLTSTGDHVDLSQWPDAVLEQNIRVLGTRLTKDPKSVLPAERAFLDRMEGEIRRRDNAMAASKSPVELCERPADLPLNGTIQLTHWWLRTPSKELGMGIKGGGVPGHAGGPAGYPGVPTTLNDHKGEVGSCTPLTDVDPECIDKALVPGKETGRWLPPFNDCHTTVQEIVKDCAKPGTNPMSTKINQEADAGVP